MINTRQISVNRAVPASPYENLYSYLRGRKIYRSGWNTMLRTGTAMNQSCIPIYGPFANVERPLAVEMTTTQQGGIFCQLDTQVYAPGNLLSGSPMLLSDTFYNILNAVPLRDAETQQPIVDEEGEPVEGFMFCASGTTDGDLPIIGDVPNCWMYFASKNGTKPVTLTGGPYEYQLPLVCYRDLEPDMTVEGSNQIDISFEGLLKNLSNKSSYYTFVVTSPIADLSTFNILTGVVSSGSAQITENDVIFLGNTDFEFLKKDLEFYLNGTKLKKGVEVTYTILGSTVRLSLGHSLDVGDRVEVVEKNLNFTTYDDSYLFGAPSNFYIQEGIATTVYFVAQAYLESRPGGYTIAVIPQGAAPAFTTITPGQYSVTPPVTGSISAYRYILRITDSSGITDLDFTMFVGPDPKPMVTSIVELNPQQTVYSVSQSSDFTMSFNLSDFTSPTGDAFYFGTINTQGSWDLTRRTNSGVTIGWSAGIVPPGVINFSITLGTDGPADFLIYNYTVTVTP